MKCFGESTDAKSGDQGEWLRTHEFFHRMQDTIEHRSPVNKFMSQIEKHLVVPLIPLISHLQNTTSLGLWNILSVEKKFKI